MQPEKSNFWGTVNNLRTLLALVAPLVLLIMAVGHQWYSNADYQSRTNERLSTLGEKVATLEGKVQSGEVSSASIKTSLESLQEAIGEIKGDIKTLLRGSN